MSSQSEKVAYNTLEKVYNDLKGIEALCSDYMLKEKIHTLIDFIEFETMKDKSAFAEIIYSKMKQTKVRYPELSTQFYILYRNLTEDKITLQEAAGLYEMYIKECTTL